MWAAVLGRIIEITVDGIAKSHERFVAWQPRILCKATKSSDSGFLKLRMLNVVLAKFRASRILKLNSWQPGHTSLGSPANYSSLLSATLQRIFALPSKVQAVSWASFPCKEVVDFEGTKRKRSSPAGLSHGGTKINK